MNRIAAIVCIFAACLLSGCQGWEQPPPVRHYRVRIVSVSQADQSGDDWNTCIEFVGVRERLVLDHKWGEVGDEFVWATYNNYGPEDAARAPTDQ